MLAAPGLSAAQTLERHFLGVAPECRFNRMPVLIVTDVTRRGEIDDTVSLYTYRRLETLGCIQVIGVVSIFGNGKSSTNEVHANLTARLAELGIRDWPVLAGPERRMSFSRSVKTSAGDLERLHSIAAAVTRHDHVVIAELGPLTVSARLLSERLVRPDLVHKILGVGGRSPGERLTTGRGLPFSFRDMNVDEDHAAVRYLVRNHAKKLWMVTYRAGVGTRMVAPAALGEIGTPEIVDHAQRRARQLTRVGYEGRIPSWDTWTTSFFLKDGPQRLSCRHRKTRFVYVPQEEAFVERRQLTFDDAFTENYRVVEFCNGE